MKHPWVILFDLDGTLLTVSKDFNRPLFRSIVDQLGIEYTGVETDSFSGRTDHDILSSFLEHHGYDQSLYGQLKSIYLNRLSSELKPEHVLRHAYVDEAVTYFSQNGFIPGVLTGNYPLAAKVKLENAKIDLEYEIGAYGEFHKDRNMLPQIALSKAEKLLDVEAHPQNFVIIGDTPRDIECAKTNGMRSVAVSTGQHTFEELESHQPDMLLESLKDPHIWFKQLVNDTV
jgi:phosphoglycolate phosphatase-like HAD superfamily hydrolase